MRQKLPQEETPAERRKTALHPIRVVARRTGLKPNLIRAWERRYAVVEPARTSGGQRLYSEAHIERLLLLRSAVEAGHAISQVAALADEDLLGLTLTPMTAPGAHVDESRPAAEEERIRACLDAVSALDSDHLSHLFEDALVELGPHRLVLDLVAPLFDRVGQLWSSHRFRPMHEHLATSVTRTFIDQLIRRQRTSPGAPLLVTAAVRGQRHELGALLVAAVAAVADWRVLHLGPDLPTEDLVAAAREVGAGAVAVSLVYPADDTQLGHELVQLRRQLGPELPLLVGGRAAAAYAPFLETVRAIRVHSLEALPPVLGELRRHVAAPPQRRLPTPVRSSLEGAPGTLLDTSVSARSGRASRPWRSRRQLFVSLEARRRYR
ncbi:MAG: MerR family transcriptional regulator, partial [Acidobacteria bacterium]|nr:MerR family transcriptional regulator [Acidobacteriota bacterium]